jgi:predicted ATPase
MDLLLPDARRLAQLAAVAGQEFAVRLLERAEGAGDGALQQGLTALLRAEIVRERARRPEIVYAFKHVLLREAALATLTPAHRRELHARIGRPLEELNGDRIDDVVEALAEQYARSGDLAKALEYLERAGAKAAALGASDAADRQWRRAVKVARRIGDAAAEERLHRLLTGVS